MRTRTQAIAMVVARSLPPGGCRDPRTHAAHSARSFLDQLRALATDDPDFFLDLLEGETNLLELIAALDASIVDDESLVDGAKAVLDKLQARRGAAENRIELRRHQH